MDYRILYHGFDTLDVAIQGALSDDALEQVEAARLVAEKSEREQLVAIGPNSEKFHVQPHGQRGGFRYVLTNGPTGALFAIKANAKPSEWNVFVSVRAARLIRKPLVQATQWLFDTLTGMGVTVTGHSVNRIDYAVDIQAHDFKLDMQGFVCPSRTKASAYWSKDHLLGDSGETLQPVMRGGRFESVTIGKMPGRQVILYDKRRAAIDLKQPHWFDVWGVERDDPGVQVWRVEVRAGKKALERLHLKRTFEAVEAGLPGFLQSAMDEIRYVVGKDDHKNVSRAETHPLWQAASDAVAALPTAPAPPELEAHILDIIRRQRASQGKLNAFGTMLGVMVLDGVPADAIEHEFVRFTTDAARAYKEEQGEVKFRRKIADVDDKYAFLAPPFPPDSEL